MKVKKCISPRHCFQKSHQTKNVENVLICPGLLCLCVIVHLLQKAVVLKMEMLFGQKKRKKNADVLFFGFISKDQAMWWNWCDFISPPPLYSLLPSLQHCGDSCSTDLTAVPPPDLIVLQDETHARVWANCFLFLNLHLLLALKASLLLLFPGDF